MKGADQVRGLAFLGILFLATRVNADATDSAPGGGPVADNVAAAQALFVEGKRLVAQGRYSEGCAQFEQSHRLDPAAGTQINLADCYERSGKLASAWLAFHDAVAAADRAHRPDWAEQARQRARILDAAVPMLTVVVDRPPPGFKLVRGGRLMHPSTYGVAVPVDPGTYEIAAEAPDHKPASAKVDVEAGARVVLQLPPLAEQPPANDTTRPTFSNPHRGSEQRAIAFAIGGAAILLMGVGTYAGLAAIADNRDAARKCPTAPRCTDPSAIVATDDARRAASVSTVAFIASGALMASAAAIYITAPTRGGASMALRVSGYGVTVAGIW